MSNIEYKYLSSLKGKIYKVLPMKEDNDQGLPTYLNSLSIELEGSLSVSALSGLSENPEYVRVVCIVKWLDNNEFSINKCRREIFKSLNILDTILGE